MQKHLFLIAACLISAVALGQGVGGKGRRQQRYRIPNVNGRSETQGGQQSNAIPGIAVGDTAVFAPNSTGGIQAFDLATGKQMWQSSTAVWPVGFGGDKVVALTDPFGGNGTQVAFFDPDTGRNTAMLGPVMFAPWTKAKFSLDGKSDFKFWVRNSWLTGMTLYWRDERWSPVTMQNYRQTQTKQVMAGRVLIDFDRNSVETHPIPPESQGEPPRLPEPAKGLPLAKGEKAITSIYISGGRILALLKTSDGTNLACYQDQRQLWSQKIRNK